MQFGDRQAARPALAHRSQRLIQQAVEIAQRHARQRADVHMQFAAGADTVGGIAAMQAAEVQRRIRHGERVVVVALFQIVAQGHDAADGVMHQLDGVHAARRVAGVAGLTQHAHGRRDMAFMRADRLQRRRLADDRAIRANRRVFREVARARHAGFFVGGRQNVERFFQLRHVHVTQRVEDKGEEAFHVGGAQAIELVVVLGQGERIARPATIVKRHGVGMAGQQQAARTGSGAGEQVKFVACSGNGLNLNVKPKIAKPTRQQID